jgi:UDP-glucose 4-epimerase
MNILLTGGAGYIGSHVALALSAVGHRAVLFDNLSNSQARTADSLSALAKQSVPLVIGDILDESKLIEALRLYQIDAVIHLAGMKAVGESVSLPIAYYKNNVSGTLSLCAAMIKAGVTKMVFSSSATVYGDPDYLPIDETHPLRATNPYGRTKLHIEQILQDLVAADARFSVVALRYFNPVGAHPSGMLGECQRQSKFDTGMPGIGN